MFSAGKDTVSVFKVSWMSSAKYYVDAFPQYDFPCVNPLNLIIS